jgi:hypothetical protein
MHVDDNIYFLCAFVMCRCAHSVVCSTMSKSDIIWYLYNLYVATITPASESKKMKDMSNMTIRANPYPTKHVRVSPLIFKKKIIDVFYVLSMLRPLAADTSPTYP